MSTPAVIQGNVVEPSAVVDPVSTAAHDVGQILRKLVVHSGGFHNEGDVLAAHSAIDSFVKNLIPQKDRRHVTSENDPAPVEDVSKRPVPQFGNPQPVMTAGTPQLDYNQLAAAIIAAQQQQTRQQEQPPTTEATG